jgi:hypothetical protein
MRKYKFKKALVIAAANMLFVGIIFLLLILL